MNLIANTAVLAPAAVLVCWTLVMFAWVMVTRMAAFKRAGINLAAAPPGSRYVEVEGSLPPRVNWVAHNFNHLHEQPTVFYALVAILAIGGAGEGVVMWAWGYTGLRIVHSLWQALVNTVPVRFTIFLLSNICLFVLAYNALRLTLG